MVAPEPPLTKFTKNSSNGETRTALKKKASMAKVSENFPKNGDSVKNLCDLNRVGVLSHICADSTLFCAECVLCKVEFRKTQHRGILH